MKIQEHVALAPLTTFGIGGSARYFCTITSEADVRAAIDFAKEKHVSVTYLAGGSNVLIADHGVDGLVAKIAVLKKVRFGNRITIGAGCMLWEEIQRAGELGLGGWEKLAGIPGTIGGAIRGNAGAFGAEIQDVLERVHAFNTTTGEVAVFQKNDCVFSYRSSFFKEHPEYVIISGDFVLTEAPVDAIKHAIASTVLERERRHLQNVPCAGSYFTNPVAPQWVQDQFQEEKGVAAKGGRVPAGWLIEKVGLRGFKIGNARSSEMHANYIINCGGATAADVLAVGETIREKVRTQYMTHLFEEVSMVGFT